MLSLQDIKFVSNDQQDYIRRLERAYEKQQEEIRQLQVELDDWREEFMF
jgi:hypothetical protein